MPETIAIQCPTCAKKFKGRDDLAGKRVKCPGCAATFTVPAARETAVKAAPQPQPAAPAPAPVVPMGKQTWTAADDDASAYGVIHEETKPRCPSCAKEMPDVKAFICPNCGYNTLTREQAQTIRTYAITGQDRLLHLLPGISALIFLLFLVVGVIFFCMVVPSMVAGSWLRFLDAESARMWITILALSMIWWSGSFVINKLILDPTPKERKKS